MIGHCLAGKGLIFINKPEVWRRGRDPPALGLPARAPLAISGAGRRLYRGGVFVSARRFARRQMAESAWPASAWPRKVSVQGA